MTVLITTETEDAVRNFIAGKISPEEFEAWIVSAIEELSKPEQSALWEIRLLLTESGEGMRSSNEARNRAEKFLADSVPQRSDAG